MINCKDHSLWYFLHLLPILLHTCIHLSLFISSFHSLLCYFKKKYNEFATEVTKFAVEFTHNTKLIKFHLYATCLHSQVFSMLESLWEILNTPMHLSFDLHTYGVPSNEFPRLIGASDWYKTGRLGFLGGGKCMRNYKTV